MLLRLPLEIKDLFREWLEANFPGRYRHVFKLIRDLRSGKDYDSSWGQRMTGNGPLAWMIGRRFEVACERLGFNKTKVSVPPPSHFRPPKPASGATRFVLIVAHGWGEGPAQKGRAEERVKGNGGGRSVGSGFSFAQPGLILVILLLRAARVADRDRGVVIMGASSLSRP